MLFPLPGKPPSLGLLLHGPRMVKASLKWVLFHQEALSWYLDKQKEYLTQVPLRGSPNGKNMEITCGPMKSTWGRELQ